jgi:hypothetical protein
MHHQQAESFTVLRGEIGTTTTYAALDTIHTPRTCPPSHPHTINPWVPHTFWPSPAATEDSTLLVWAHPNPVAGGGGGAGWHGDDEKIMDRLFFQNILMYTSDVAEGKEKLGLVRVMLMQ